METLRGQLVGFREICDHWGLASIEIATGEKIKATGKLIGSSVGDTLEFSGTWEDTKFGRQFKIARCASLNPSGTAGVIAWIASRCPDVGESRAREMVSRFGDELWSVIADDPSRLCEIKGVTATRARAISDAYDEFKGERDSMAALYAWQLSAHQISQCVRMWGPLATVVEKLRNDPYSLCEVDGFGFLRADKIARAMGVRLDSPARIRAGVLQVLAEARGRGHCYVAGRRLQALAAALLGVGEVAVGKQLAWARDHGGISVDGWRVYLPDLLRAETRVAEAVKALLEANSKRAVGLQIKAEATDTCDSAGIAAQPNGSSSPAPVT
jgi:exodeoxyribonuclease V alpha subunit